MEEKEGEWYNSCAMERILTITAGGNFESGKISVRIQRKARQVALACLESGIISKSDDIRIVVQADPSLPGGVIGRKVSVADIPSDKSGALDAPTVYNIS